MKNITKARIKQVVDQVTEQCVSCAALEGCTTKPSECTVRIMINKKAIVTNVTNVTDDQCFISGNEVKTNSLKIAEIFGKRHAHVCDKIKNLNCSDDFRSANFSAHPYINEQNGETHTMFDMTKDGFIFVVMGFTGKKAAGIKEAYIATFNQMAEQLRNGGGFAIPKGYAGALQLAADQQKEIERHDTSMDAVKSAMDDLNKAFNNLK